VTDWLEDDEPKRGDRVLFIEGPGRDGRTPRARSVTLAPCELARQEKKR